MPAAAKPPVKGKSPASKQSPEDVRIPLNTSVTGELHEALTAYARDKGMDTPQDVLRVAGTLLMRKEGYMK